MNFLINKHIQKVKIPEGLNELLSDISREVLRSQPTKIYPFIADYLESMLLTRDHTFIAAKTIESLVDCSMNAADCMQVIGIDFDRANQAATVIQNNFRKHLKMIHATGECTFSNIRDLNTIEELLKRGIIKYSEAKLCLNIIYTAFKSFYHQQANASKIIKTNNSQKWLECIENTLKIYRMSKPSSEKIERAAVTVQAAYKGYYVRRYKHSLAELRKLSDIIIFEGKLPKEIIHKQIIKPNLDDILSSIIQEIKEKSENKYIIESNLQDILDWALSTLNENVEYNKSDIGLDIEEKRIAKNHEEIAAQIIQQAFRKYLAKKKSEKIEPAANKGYYVQRYKHSSAELRKLSDMIIFEGKLPKEIIHKKLTKPNLDDILSSIMQEIKEKSENKYIDIEEKRIAKNHEEFAAQKIQRAFRKYLSKKKSKKDLTFVSSIPDSAVSKFERDQEIEVLTETLSQKIQYVHFVVPPAPSPSIENNV